MIAAVNAPDPTELVQHGYDSVSYLYRGDRDSPAEYAAWLTNLQQRIPTNASVLDLGCGCGIPVAKALTNNGHHVTGVDLSEVQINRARHLVPQATFLHADATRIAFAASTFDAVICLYALIHMPIDAQPHLIRRFLPRDISGDVSRQRELGRRLKKQRRFADPGIAADQRRRSFDESAAQRAIELGNAAGHAFRQRNLGIEAHELQRATARLQIMLGLERRDDRASLLHQRVPFAAIGALPRPAMAHGTARLADIAFLRLGHRQRLADVEREGNIEDAAGRLRISDRTNAKWRKCRASQPFCESCTGKAPATPRVRRTDATVTRHVRAGSDPRRDDDAPLTRLADDRDEALVKKARPGMRINVSGKGVSEIFQH